MYKNAIATLVKNNPSINQNWENNFIILRNRSIQRYLIDKNVDLIIFHENDFDDKYKKYIKDSCENTLSKNIKFIEVPDFKPTHDEFNILKTKTKDPNVISTGYSSMCKFWAYGFLEYVKDYDKLIRIDDDCLVLSNIDVIFEKLENKVLVFPFLGGEKYRENLKEYINKFFLEIYPIKNFEPFEDGIIKCPYTNFCGFNLKKIHKNKHFYYFFKWLDENKFIYLHSWQDTQLWGLLMKILIGEDDWLEYKNTKYIHLSHLSFVN